MINGSSKITVRVRESLRKLLPIRGKITRRMIIEVINIPDDHTIIYVYKPLAKKPSSAGPGDNHSEMGYDKSLGGELKGPSIW